MAIQEECAKCTNGKNGSRPDEIRCSFLGRTLQFDDQQCAHFSSNTQQCPECGLEIPKTSATCPQCGYPLKPTTAKRGIISGNFSLLNTGAEPILNKYGKAIKIIGLILMIIFFLLAIWMLIQMFEHDESAFLFSALSLFISGIVVYLICIVVKAFIDVFVNMSVTLQNIDAKTQRDS